MGAKATRSKNTMTPAEQLVERAQKIGGVDEVSIMGSGDEAMVSMWAQREVAGKIREVAEELGFNEGPSYGDGTEVFLPFEGAE